MMLSLFMLLSSAYAKDFGIQGQVFPIEERDPVAVIQERLSHLDPHTLQRALEAAREEDRLFPPIEGWTPTHVARAYAYDPTYMLTRDIIDHRGHRVFKKGERINPLDYASIHRTLLFIDGREPQQVMWALKENAPDSKYILVAGSPQTLMKSHDHSFYYDQQGTLFKAFGIQHIPARVSISGGHVWVEEIVLEDRDA